jgi:hypothetical protein
LAARYGILGGESESKMDLRVTVVNVNDVQAYAQVSRYLKQLGPVKNLQLLGVQDHTLQFSLKVDGGQFALEQALHLGQSHLKQIPNKNKQGLTLQWRS